MQNTAGQVGGFLSQANEQPGAAAVGQHGAHFGSLSRHPADWSGDTAYLAADPDAELPCVVVAAIAFVDVDAADLDPG